MQQKGGPSYVNFRKGKSKDSQSKNSKKWMHSESVLTNNCVSYCGKYLGDVEVPGAKGMDIIKNAAMKLKFAQSLHISEAGRKGSKLKKIELKVSVDSLKVIDPKTKACLHQRPLHRISYCADDEDDSKFFAFIAKEQDSNTHKCFAFIMEQDACAVTLTVGQAFNIAYQNFCKRGRQEMKETKKILDVTSHVEAIKKPGQVLKQTSLIEPRPAINGPQLKKWTTFDDGDLNSSPNSSDAFENCLFGLQQQRSLEMHNGSDFDMSSDRSSEISSENGTLFMENMYSENSHEPRLGGKDKDATPTIAKPPTKRDVRLGKKISWDG